MAGMLAKKGKILLVRRSKAQKLFLGPAVFCLFLLGFCTTAYCGQMNRIILTDGSMVNGEIVSYENGIYVIRTANFGEVKVESAKVFRIDSIKSPLPSVPSIPVIHSSNPTSSEINRYRQELMSDPESAAIITGLAVDPQIQEIAKDPQLQDAVEAGDIQALMRNKKFIDMLNNPKMQDAIKKIKQQRDTQ